MSILCMLGAGRKGLFVECVGGRKGALSVQPAENACRDWPSRRRSGVCPSPESGGKLSRGF